MMTQIPWTYATVESLTGGALAALFTSQAGSSAWYRGGIVAYQESVKRRLLGIKEIDDYADTELATALAQSSPIKAKAVISTTGYIDHDYAYSIVVNNRCIAERILLTSDILALPRSERQRHIAKFVLGKIQAITGDNRLTTAPAM
jgi:hypothetical protein